MNQDMIGMMVCMIVGVLSLLTIVVLAAIQTVLQAKILQGVRQISRKPSPGSNP